jgi:hypothetical protein
VCGAGLFIGDTLVGSEVRPHHRELVSTSAQEVLS